MKKLILAILLLLLASPAWATTYYAQAGTGNMSAIEWDTSAGGGGTDLVWANRQAGDIFIANAQTGIVVDQDPGAPGKVVLDTSTNGGGFVITTGTITVTADIGVVGNTGTSDVLTVSGGTVTILGNIYGGGTTGADGLVISGSSTTVTIGANGSPVTIVGGTTGTCNGVNDTHTVTTTTVYANSTGGTNGTAHGYNIAQGAVTYNGNGTGGTGDGVRLAGSGSVTVNGDCIGSAASRAGFGCNGYGAALTVTGSIVGASLSTGVAGKIIWAPSSAKKYVKFDGGGTAIYASAYLASDSAGTKITPADTAAQVKSTAYFIKSDDYDGSTLTQGTATSAGGGAWGF